VQIKVYAVKDEGVVKDNKDLGKVMGVFTFCMV
jgi:hypothetical protein